MIFVDTSVWIEALRSADSAAAQQLTALLDASDVALAAPVRIEILIGASNRDNPRLRRVLSALPIFFPTETTWTRIDDWLQVARTAGGVVWSLDDDFARMNGVGFISIYRT